jgi:quercetin dioxygenase-like cupin family protein
VNFATSLQDDLPSFDLDGFGLCHAVQLILLKLLIFFLIMSDTTVIKVTSEAAPTGNMGQKHLALSKQMAMRLWENEQPGEPKPVAKRPYEAIGYVIAGRAELHLEDQMVILEPGNSWVVPEGASHTYKILEPFTAVEVTTPPAVVHGRNQT